jgi:hypothetical protein
MNLSEIRNECWGIARETAEDDSNRLWTTREMNRYINRIYFKIARETRCIRDATTPAVCRIACAPPASLEELTTSAATNAFAAVDLADYNDSASWAYETLMAPNAFPKHAAIIDIDEVKWNGSWFTLTPVSVNKWRQSSFWERRTGVATEYALDYTTGYIALNSRVTEADTLRLSVKRIPLTVLSANSDIPEIPLNYHDFFVNGVLWLMYSKKDSQTLDKEASAKYYADFLVDMDEIKRQEMRLEQRLDVNYPMPGFI